MSRVVAIIPAKLTSTRLPQKNLALIEGQALFVFSIRAALRAKHIDDVYVSSESSDLLAIASQNGARTIHRPPELSHPTVTNQAVVAHAVSSITESSGAKPQLVVLLQPTHPFRVPTDIDAAIEVMKNDLNASSVFALKPTPKLYGKIDDEVFMPDVPLPRDKSIEIPKYVNTGAFYVIDVVKTIDSSSFFGNHIRPCLLSRPELEIDIDEPLDLVLAQSIAAHFRPDLIRLGLLEAKS